MEEKKRKEKSAEPVTPADLENAATFLGNLKLFMGVFKAAELSRSAETNEMEDRQKHWELEERSFLPVGD